MGAPEARRARPHPSPRGRYPARPCAGGGVGRLLHVGDDGEQCVELGIGGDGAVVGGHAAAAGYPILPCNLCGSQSDLKRVVVKRWLAELEERLPNVRQVMVAALKMRPATGCQSMS